jgi:serpin B
MRCARYCRYGFVVLALGSALAAGWSCSDRSADATAAIATSDAPRNTSPDATPAEIAALVDGNLSFGLALQAALGTDGNQMISPYSIGLAFGMTYAGARGPTADELATVLQFTLPADRLHTAFDALDLALAARNSDDVALRAANALWAQRSFSFEAAFLDVLAVDYGAPVRLLDFAGAPEASRRAVNAWVSDATGAKIPELLPAGSLNRLVRFVLTNALYFKAPWASPFAPSETSPASFHRLDGSTVIVDFMKQDEALRFQTGEGWQAVELPYKGGQEAMVILLPDAGRFAEVTAGLTAATLRSAFDLPPSQRVHLAMPKFKFETKTTLKGALSGLGMPTPFGLTADFSGMCPDELSLDEVYHDTSITVDEEGSEAAAATGIVGVLQSDAGVLQTAIVLDRPFLFFIRDLPTGAVLFAGRTLDPSQN